MTTAIEELDYNSLLNDIKTEFKKLMPDYELLESDRYAPLLEAIAFREMLLRSRINHIYKSMLLPFATGVDLDEIVTLYGIKRENGVYPKADVEFKLSKVADNRVVISKGIILTSGSGKVARLINDVVMAKGEISATGVTELLEYTAFSDIKCEVIQTPLPFLINAKQLTDFINGGSVEDDEGLRKRAIFSLKSITTAGSVDSYIFHALSADTRIEDAIILSPEAGVVQVHLLTRGNQDETILTNVLERFSDKKVRPLTDIVEVKFAKPLNVEISAVIELTDMLLQAEVDKSIRASIPAMKLGEDLNISRVYKLLHSDNVYCVTLLSPQTDIKVKVDEYVVISSLNLEYKIAEL